LCFIVDAFSGSPEGDGEAAFVRTSPTHKTNFEGEGSDEEAGADRPKRQRINELRPAPPPMNRPPPPPPPKGKQHPINRPKPPPPSKPTQGQPPPSNSKRIQPPPPQKSPKSNSVVDTISREKQQSPTVSQKSKDSQNPSDKPKINLPPGWISVWSKSQQRWYYFDQRTNKSVWEWPPPSGT
jgi:outer membrane biosynthesis protein TonB